MNKNETKQYLLNLDVTFCKDASLNKEEGWASYFSDNAVMVTGGHNQNIVGKSNIKTAMKSVYELENIDFQWAPTYVEVSDDLTMGVTSGNYTRTYRHDSKNYKETGKYTTIWKKIDGSWKIILDGGNVQREVVE